ncbi:response regulator transcription factor [Pedobacter insulae]|uniref:DNA-binding response regulator, NarL/FixJ family, contains REC and HTH domains n=1 Tax=Pedobacter insulae TaxID=414048 RepID=A0A1I2YVR0_9SPHI|nr:response regulator transcription factor [Pedobacter insulae]SFH29714.1 DNA-binding response regulator, NarL/FixJ family, contains REC and HTH domains [Pedobacter insulae]
MNKKITLAIVDDQALFCLGLAVLMKEFEEIDVVFTAKNGMELQDKIKKHGPIDVVLMDISMPIMDGYATTQWLNCNYPSIRILALSMFDDEKTIIQMINCGAGGYLLKEAKPAEVLHAIKVVKTKGFYTSELVTGRLAVSSKKVKIKPVLTEKERMFLELSAAELTHKEIALQMHVSHRTVDNYRDSLFKKLNTRSKTGLIIQGIENGLINIIKK